MKLKILVVLLFLAPLSVRASERVEGYMLCKVKSQRIEMIDEGMSSSFSHVNGSFEVDDTLTFEYYVLADGFFSMRLAFGNDDLVSVWSPNLNNEEATFYDGNRSIGLNWTGREASINPDWVSIDSGDQEVMLRRYYKDDWQGVLVKTDFFKGVGAHVATFDCRTRGASITDFISATAIAAGR